MIRKYDNDESIRRLRAIAAFCDEFTLPFPAGSATEFAFKVIENTSHYRRQNSGRKEAPLGRSIHIYLLVEYLRKLGLKKAEAIELLLGTGNTEWTYHLDASRLAKLHQQGQRFFSRHVVNCIENSSKHPSTVIGDIIKDLAKNDPKWSKNLPDISIEDF